MSSIRSHSMTEPVASLAQSHNVVTTPCLIKEVEDARGKSDRYDFWNYVYGFKMSSMRSLSMSEPVLSLAQSHNVVTTPCLIKEVDIYTCGKKKFVFCSPFYLDTIRKDTVQSLMTYFDVSFTD